MCTVSVWIRIEVCGGNFGGVKLNKKFEMQALLFSKYKPHFTLTHGPACPVFPMSVLLETSLGRLVIDLFTDEAPKACENFLKLCKVKYYNNVLFHSVQKDTVCQSGDPTGTGRGGESVWGLMYGAQAKYFKDEIDPLLLHNEKGLVAMANAGKDKNASQFYITITDRHLDFLDGQHTVFGKVEEGLDVLDKINAAYVDDDNRPLQNIRIRHTAILFDPFPDPKRLEIPDKSPEPVRDTYDTNRLADDEELEEDQRTLEEIEKALQEKESKSRAEVLEMIGDIPDADFKPPDNVLFVCKLNPVTRDEDLELIFSQCGKIMSCE
eukprot:g2347.t1